MVVPARQGDIGLVRLDHLIATSRIETFALTAAPARLAHAACVEFGKGCNPAALTFGDCCAYALAQSLCEPLLFKGTDFARIDLTAVV